MCSRGSGATRTVRTSAIWRPRAQPSRRSPFIRYLSNTRQFTDLPNGNVCLALSGNGDAFQARAGARRARTGVDLAYSVPREGAQVWFDMLAIPAGAPHVANAHRFIDYLLDPQVAAAMTNATGFATANAAARRYIDPALLADPLVFPPREAREHLFPDPMKSDAYMRARLRMWTRFKTGR